MNKNFLKAMFCVTFFSVATRALGFILKIYLSRNLGSVMLGSYQVAMSIFAVMMTFVSSGIPVVLSRNVSYYAGTNNKKSIGSIVSSGLILTFAICSIVSIIIIFFPNLLNVMFTSNASTEMLQILLPALVFSSIYEVLRGALWGEQKFFVISFTEFLEQVTRIVAIVILFETTFLDMSLTNKTALSLSIACIISAVVVTIIYIKFGGKINNPKYEFKNLLKTSTPITAVRTISSIVSSIIAIIIPIRLMAYGFTETEALSEFGIIMGMTFPLIMIPSTLISSLAVTMIPSISEQSNDIDNNNLKDKSILKSKINFSIRTTVVFSSLLISTFLALGIPICRFLYDNSKAGLYLCYSAVLMLPMGISQITSSILNAIGLELKSLKNYAVSSGLLIVCIYFLPKYIGTFALLIGYFLMSLTSSILNIKMLSKRGLIEYKFIKTIISMLAISIFSSILASSIYHLFSKILILGLIAGGIVSAGSTILLVYLFNIANFKMIIFKHKHIH
ncbi:MAG: oligosaccharide flippase family protein [Clostridia bacterium]|nr:oligosaccharide flippase family protein [Clostridia bacterium]